MIRSLKTVLTILFLFQLRLIGLSQEFGFQTGMIIHIGTHVNNMGWMFNSYYTNRFYQFNFGMQKKLNITSYGGRKLFFESRIAAGAVLLGGKRQQLPDFEMDGLLHNTTYNNSVGFNYLIYWDDAGTSQLSGGWSLGLKKVTVLFENDVFGGQSKDRFRSGILEIAYRDGFRKYFADLYFWTGETRHSVWKREPLPCCPNGYRSLEGLPYGDKSHGIISVGFRSQFLPGVSPLIARTYTVKAGIDSENIRHFFQNRLSHDLIFMPKSYKRTTPHYPRLDENGKPVFTKKERRKDRLYFQASINENWSN